MRIKYLFLFISINIISSLCACVQKMGKDGHLKPMEENGVNGFFSRMTPAETVSQSPDRLTHQSLEGQAQAHRFSQRSLLKGQELYRVFCMPCHGMSGYGDGMIVQRGFLAPPSYHTDRLRNAPDQHFYDVITHGYGAMYSYADRVPGEERWAIIGYIRALQFSQNVDFNTLNGEEKKRLRDGP